MSTTFHSIETSNDNLLLPALLSVLVHGLVVVALLFVRVPPPIATPTGIETSLVSADELAEINGLLQAAADNSASANATSAPSLQLQAYNADLARREAEYQAQIAAFAAEQDRAAAQAVAQLEAELAAQYAEEQAKLEEARAAYANQDEIIKENQAQLEKARQARDEAIVKQEQESKDSGGKKVSISAGSTNNSETSSNSSGDKGSTSSSGASSGSNKASIQAAVTAHIKRYWQPIGDKGRLSASIRVDAGGNVLSVSVSGGTEAQRKTLESAIYAASPITPIVGTEFRSFSPQFIIQ